MFCSFCDPFSSSTRPVPHLLTALAPLLRGGPDTLHARADLAKISIFGFSNLFYCCPAVPANLACANHPRGKNWCFCSQLKTSFQETLRRQFGMIGPRLLEHPPLEELNPEMKIRCVFKIEVWRALERSGCFGFRSGELQQNSTRVCKPHQKQPFTCTSFDGRQSNIS